MNGTCRNGDGCNDFHPDNCTYYKKGSCRAGNKCAYRHPKRDGNISASESEGTKKAKAKTKAKTKAKAKGKAKKGKANPVTAADQQPNDDGDTRCYVCQQDDISLECGTCGNYMCNHKKCWVGDL